MRAREYVREEVSYSGYRVRLLHQRAVLDVKRVQKNLQMATITTVQVTKPMWEDSRKCGKRSIIEMLPLSK